MLTVLYYFSQQSVIAPPTRQSIVIIIEGKMKAHNTVVHCFYSHSQENSRLCSNFNTMYKNNKHYNISPVQLTSASALLSHSFPLLWPKIVLPFSLSGERISIGIISSFEMHNLESKWLQCQTPSQ